ncbi:MAG TPA: TIGR04063 family PEP-CTERM/XrtA system glycosyltransferase [Burkholderiaceae bacterium]|nr:TIGR04063 family PEP-CTERM/XrtA system glycosyltransferase [Burkholderiaceae bacterium]
MRILHILDHSLPLHSGYSFRTAAILREQRNLGWETIHLTTPRQGVSALSVEVADGWTFHRTPFVPGWRSRVPAVGGYVDEMRATALRLEELVEQLRPDVLHAHSPVLNALPALSVARRHSLPLVYEMRASWEDAAVDHGSTRAGSARYRASRALETFALKRADAITTICEGLRTDIAARGIDADAVTVIPNAVDVKAFAFDTPADGDLRRRLGLDGATVIGFAGSFYGYEGLDLLLDAVALLVKQQPDTRVLLVGGGPQEQALRAQAGQLGLSERVVFSGRVPHADVARYYNLIDVLAYPRRSIRLTEIVTPLKPLEAMAQGRIFVASDVGGHRELVRDGETGFLFPAGDANALARILSEVLARRGEWQRMKLRARSFVESERTWARSVARYTSVYSRVLARRHEALAAARG